MVGPLLVGGGGDEMRIFDFEKEFVESADNNDFHKKKNDSRFLLQKCL